MRRRSQIVCTAAIVVLLLLWSTGRPPAAPVVAPSPVFVAHAPVPSVQPNTEVGAADHQPAEYDPWAVLDRCHLPGPTSRALPLVRRWRAGAFDVEVRGNGTDTAGALRLCAGVVTISPRDPQSRCPPGLFSHSAATQRAAEHRFGPDWFEGALAGPAVVPLRFRAVGGPCPTAYTAPFDLPPSHVPEAQHEQDGRPEYRLLLSHLFDRHRHLDERHEEAALTYVPPATSDLVPPPALVLLRPGRCGGKRQGVWVSTGPDTTDYRAGALGGYWLSVRGVPTDPRVPSFTPDLLGRMAFGRRYALAPGPGPTGCPAAPPPCDDGCMRRLLQGRRIVFIGDSHMRILFYGLLARLRVPFPANKVWRGDRTDVLPPPTNATVQYVASYFLNTSRPQVQDVLRSADHPIVVAGVGQHHASHCWSLAKHAEDFRRSMRLLARPFRSGGRTTQRTLLWLGVPGQPVNRHLFLPKRQGGQGRRDCRNNARHAVFDAAQQAAVAELAAENTEHRVRFVDAFGPSLGMGHTTLDGAHFFTSVRDAWLDGVGAALRQLADG